MNFRFQEIIPLQYKKPRVLTKRRFNVITYLLKKVEKKIEKKLKKRLKKMVKKRLKKNG